MKIIFRFFVQYLSAFRYKCVLLRAFCVTIITPLQFCQILFLTYFHSLCPVFVSERYGHGKTGCERNLLLTSLISHPVHRYYPPSRLS